MYSSSGGVFLAYITGEKSVFENMPK